MGITCKELFKGIDCTVLGNEDDPIEDIAYHSKRVLPGDAFFCIVGHEYDGHTFAQEAIDNGARVLVVERVPHLADSTDVTEVVVGHTRKVMGAVAAQVNGHPTRSMDLVGVTGTYGKRAVPQMVARLVQASGKRSGLVGMDSVQIAGEDFEPQTPLIESPDVQRLFADMLKAGCQVVAMAVDGQSPHYKKVLGSTFAVTAFTDLAMDGLGHHLTFESYFEAKAKLFSKDYPASRVICIDNPWGKELLKRASRAEDNVITTGFDPSAQIHMTSISTSADDPHVVLDVRGTSYEVPYRLVDERDAQNMMCAFGVCMQLGMQPRDIAAAFGAVLDDQVAENGVDA